MKLSTTSEIKSTAKWNTERIGKRLLEFEQIATDALQLATASGVLTIDDVKWRRGLEGWRYQFAELDNLIRREVDTTLAKIPVSDSHRHGIGKFLAHHALPETTR